MKRLLIIAILSLLISSVFSQKSFEEATITKNSGELIIGYINYENWNISPMQIEFKLSEQGELEIYKPGEIKSFSVHGENYISATVQTETSPRDVDYLKHDATLQIQEKTIFLGILYQANKSLAYYTDELGYTNFYILIGQNYELLIFKSFLIEQDQKTLIQENSKFKGQLIVYLNDCPEILSQIQASSYNQQSLLKVFTSYHNKCAKEIKKVYVRHEEKLKKKFGITAGVSISNYHFNSDIDYLSKADFKTMIGPSAGFFLELYLPRAKDKWSINNEVVFHNYKTEGKYQDSYNLHEMRIGELNLNISNIVRHHFKIKWLDLFANIGMVNQITLAKTNERLFSSPGFNNVVQSSEALLYVRNWKFGLSVGGGISYQHFSLEYRFMISDAIAIYSKPAYWINSSFFYLNYYF